jgi:hypothetical protein
MVAGGMGSQDPGQQLPSWHLVTDISKGIKVIVSWIVEVTFKSTSPSAESKVKDYSEIESHIIKNSYFYFVAFNYILF